MAGLRGWLRRRILVGDLVALVALVTLVACDLDDSPPNALPPTAAPADFPFPPTLGSAGSCAFSPSPVPGVMPITPPTPAQMPAAPSPQFMAAPVRADVPPPPVSGGTLHRTADASKLVAADPDRDAIYLIDIPSRSLERRIALRPHEEPGRVVEDSAGRIHVVLRGSRSIATFDPRSSAEPRRSEVCDLPRGIAYDAAHDRLYVACAEGKLVRVDPKSGAPDRKVELGRDLRDVVVHEDGLYVSRFRSAELLQLDAESGIVVAAHYAPNTIEANSVVNAPCGLPAARPVQAAPRVAWRSVGLPGRGVVMLHQRAETSDVRTSAGGYAERTSCSKGVVRSGISIFTGASQPAQDSIDLNSGGLFVDLAIDPTGTLAAVANAGGWGTRVAAQVFTLPGASSTAAVVCASALRTVSAEGQVTALAFITPELLAAQLREPAGIAFYAWPLNGAPDSLDAMPPAAVLDLRQPTRADTGHTMFHVATDAGLACASCHPEAGDDGHTWKFSGFGARRTPSLRGEVLATAPFQWSGSLRDFPALFEEVFVKRMTGPLLDTGRVDLLAQWIDAQAALRATPPDPEAVERGKSLFESEELRCAECHSGEHFTNNQNTFVGTGAVIQVPSLLGVSFRAPFIHNGCARTLADLYGSCAGGEKHGHTEQLSDDQKRDLDAYLESL